MQESIWNFVSHFIFFTYYKINQRKGKKMKDFDFLKNKAEFPVGMAYVPWQNMEQVYENLEEAFKIGTLFPELNKPFEGRRRP